MVMYRKDCPNFSSGDVVRFKEEHKVYANLVGAPHQFVVIRQDNWGMVYYGPDPTKDACYSFRLEPCEGPW